MNYLLDTHILLWALTEPKRLTPAARAAIVDRSNSVFVSVASGWEIAIKYGLGKLPLPLPPGDLVPQGIERSGFQLAPIRLEHALAVADLPKHHADPFDRLLITQALIDNLTIVTVDKVFAKYSVPCV